VNDNIKRFLFVLKVSFGYFFWTFFFVIFIVKKVWKKSLFWTKLHECKVGNASFIIGFPTNTIHSFTLWVTAIKMCTQGRLKRCGR